MSDIFFFFGFVGDFCFLGGFWIEFDVQFDFMGMILQIFTLLIFGSGLVGEGLVGVFFIIFIFFVGDFMMYSLFFLFLLLFFSFFIVIFFVWSRFDFLGDIDGFLFLFIGFGVRYGIVRGLFFFKIIVLFFLSF